MSAKPRPNNCEISSPKSRITSCAKQSRSCEFLERFGLTSLEELPPLDVDVAARLADEGNEPVTEPMFSPEPD
jgi:hypothetical protein